MKLKEIDNGEWIMISRKDLEDLILIDRKDYQDLIETARKKGVDVEILEAVYSWLVDKNVLTGMSKENDDTRNGL